MTFPSYRREGFKKEFTLFCYHVEELSDVNATIAAVRWKLDRQLVSRRQRLPR